MFKLNPSRNRKAILRFEPEGDACHVHLGGYRRIRTSVERAFSAEQG